jgi:diguanylate cyclase (GGDEF)-like protein
MLLPVKPYGFIRRPDERWIGIAGVATVAVISVIGFAFRTMPLPRLGSLGPAALLAAVIGNLATAAVLFVTWQAMPKRRAAFALGLSFAGGAILALVALLAIPPSADDAPVLPVSNQSGAWLYLFWHAAAAIGGISYIFLLWDSRPPGRTFLLTATATAAAVTALFIVTALAFVDHLPVQIVAGGGIFPSGAGPFVAGLLVITSLLAFHIPRPTRIERMLAISLLAMTLDIFLVSAGGHRYSAAFYASRTLEMLSSLFVFATAIQVILASRSKLSNVEATLSQVAIQAEQRSDRIRALGEMASDFTSSKSVRFHRMLQIAAEVIRPEKFMFAALLELDGDGDKVVVVATAWAASQAADQALNDVVHPGAEYPFAESIVSLMPVEAGARAWNDLSVVKDRRSVAQAVGFRSFIGAPVRLGGRTYFATFASLDLMTDDPFVEEDIAYVEVVASLVAGQANQQRQFEQIQFDIEHDALTGLKNRSQFHTAIRKELEAGRPFVVALANLDGFRYLNEREGHEIGDDVLVALAVALKAISPGNEIARLSGDEFGILIRDANAAGAASVALDRYARIFSDPIHVGARNGARVLTVGASIGAACSPADGASLELLVRRAAVALDVAKKQGGTQTMVFETSMEALVQETHLRYVELSDAIAHDELALVYQPTFDLASRTVTGAEALVRWDHPERGRLSPAEFIDFAERSGLMSALSRWVLDRVVRDMTGDGVTWPPGFRIYFNLGAQMLDDIAFISHLKDVLRDVPHIAGHLGIEVTETAAMQNVERSMYSIDLIRRWGLAVAIDDFGTGHSSLAYLKQLTVDTIKIDRSFINGLPDDERDAALTEMLLRISERFGFVTLAEGIETEPQAAWLLEHGCRLGQGYLLARPAPFEELVRRMAAEAKWLAGRVA